MTSLGIEDLLLKRQKVVKAIELNQRIIKGSPVSLARECGQPNCRCRKGKKHVSLYVSQSYKSKTKMTYIPHRYENLVEESVKRCRKLFRAIEELSEINLEIIRQRGKL